MPRHRRGWAVGAGGPERGHHTGLTVAMLEPVLLMLVRQQPQHGYTLLSELEGLGLTTVHPSVVYRILRELEALAWIESIWDTSQTQGPPRKVYTLTPEGDAALRNWQVELDKVQKLIDLVNQADQPGKGV